MTLACDVNGLSVAIILALSVAFCAFLVWVNER